MPTLADIQRRFARSMRDGRNAAAGLIVDDGVPPELRLAIHRNNTYASLVEVLTGAFPRVAALLDEGRFRTTAASYVGEELPSRSQLAKYGAKFPAFLERLPLARIYPWLPDLARLEWARHEAFFAADAVPLTPEAVSSIPAERYSDLRLRLHPAVRWVTAQYPVDQLWEASAVPAHVAPQRVAVLVMRPNLAVVHTVITAADTVFLHAVASGQTLDGAAEAVLNEDPHHDLQTMLASHLSNGVFSIDSLGGI